MENTSITSSAITNTTLDMAMQNITSVLDPVDPQDAATKFYVDRQVTTLVQTFEVQLAGQAFVEVSNLKYGSYQVLVMSLQEGGPVGSFVLLKLSEYSQGVITSALVLKTPTGEQLVVDWPPNSAVLVRKSGDNFDGLYRVKII